MSLSPGFLPHRCAWSLPFYTITDRKKLHCMTDEFLINTSFIMHITPARAMENSGIPTWQTHCTLHFGFRLEHFKQFDVTHILNLLLWLWTEGITQLILLQIISRTCRSGWFSIFWINSRTLVLCAYFTTECGNPGIRNSMSPSFTILMTHVMISNGSFRYLSKYLI